MAFPDRSPTAAAQVPTPAADPATAASARDGSGTQLVPQPVPRIAPRIAQTSGPRIVLHEHRQRVPDGEAALAALLPQLDQRRGMALTHDHARAGAGPSLVAFVDPPLAITGRGDELLVKKALSPRGRLLLGPVAAALADCPLLERAVARPERVRARLRAPAPVIEEADRLRQPTLLACARAVLATLPAHPLLGLYGAIGYDCVRRLRGHPEPCARARTTSATSCSTCPTSS